MSDVVAAGRQATASLIPIGGAFGEEGGFRIAGYWPIGGTGHSVGEINTLFQVSGVDNAGSAHRTGLKTSYDGRYYMMPCRRTSDGALGGHRIDLIAGTAGPFIKTPLQSKNDTSRAAMGISALGTDTFFNANLGDSYNRYQIKNVVTDTVTASCQTSIASLMWTSQLSMRSNILSDIIATALYGG